ncbi:MAG: lytic transglycosylase domain-containing protein [Synechococcaceae cyanobacterium SM1_2_3]|nr:lytic transglycosylase domain-containing protein [Synechococcaceae cyanobacterium SM1_2_3]
MAEAFSNGRTHQVEPELILAIIAVESTFKEQAVSREGARGLMQVLPRSHPQKCRILAAHTPCSIPPRTFTLVPKFW